MNNHNPNIEADNPNNPPVTFGLVFDNSKVAGFKMPEHNIHKEQEKQQIITAKDKKLMIAQGRRCLEAWQRWLFTNNGYGDSSLTCLGKIRSTRVDHTPNLSTSRSVDYVIEALSIMERGSIVQKKYAKLIKAVMLNQQQKETPRKTLERLEIASSAKQYSSAEYTISRIIANIQKTNKS